MLHSFFNQTNTMAKVKEEAVAIERIANEEQLLNSGGETEPVNEEQTLNSGAENQFNTDSKQEKRSKTKGVKAEDLPENIKSALRAFPNHKELYINKFGGVFSVDTDEYALGEGAVLYQNPFYKG